MPELPRHEWALMNIRQVRDQLSNTAAAGGMLTPEQMENAAGKLTEGLRIIVEDSA